MFWPLKRTAPPMTSAGGLSSWAMANSSVDLPHPDSPTMPRNSPAASSKLTLSTALDGFADRHVVDAQVDHLKDDAVHVSSRTGRSAGLLISSNA